jgi:hypothetical protein
VYYIDTEIAPQNDTDNRDAGRSRPFDVEPPVKKLCPDYDVK